ncbi:hypothetical protein EDB89DRAFT_804315 [Lactarius sanguifluus]|nr:hypothetical protein EDB89DRAFT_804315 [Lactarius sanguifluus]
MQSECGSQEAIILAREGRHPPISLGPLPLCGSTISFGNFCRICRERFYFPDGQASQDDPLACHRDPQSTEIWARRHLRSVPAMLAASARASVPYSASSSNTNRERNTPHGPRISVFLGICFCLVSRHRAQQINILDHPYHIYRPEIPLLSGINLHGDHDQGSLRSQNRVAGSRSDFKLATMWWPPPPFRSAFGSSTRTGNKHDDSWNIP